MLFQVETFDLVLVLTTKTHLSKNADVTTNYAIAGSITDDIESPKLDT